MISLLALSRAEFAEVTFLHRLRFLAHLATLAAATLALYMNEPFAYWLSVTAALTETTAWLLRMQAARQHRHAAEALRRAMLIDAYGETAEPLDTTDLRQGFKRRTEKKAFAFEDPNYYASNEAKGPARLLSHLQESAFWSKHLFRAAATQGLGAWAVVIVLVAFVGVFAQPFFSPSAALNFARSAALFLSFISVSDGIGRALEWKHAADQAEAVDRRLEGMRPDVQEAIVAAFTDYGVATASAAPIPPTVYRAEKVRLDERWLERKKLSRSTTSG